MKDPLIGTRINRYEIRESIHKSDVIGIYKAFDTKLERFVLIKTILHSSEYSNEAVEFFLAESRTLAKLTHPNIAKVLDFGYENGNLYLISEYVTGTSLADLLNRPIPWQQAINILLPLTNALVYAHGRGIIHRDLKPGNIILNADQQPILSDFSLMRIIEEEETRDMTGTNVGLGSPEYISPEQGQGLTVDFRSDVYSLGVIFFEMVTGKKLFYAPSSMEIVIQHILADPPKPRTIVPTLPRTVETVILNALSKDPGRRYQTMEEVSDALKALVDDSNRKMAGAKTQPRKRILFAGVGLILLLIIGLAIRSVFTSASETQETALPTDMSTAASLISTPTPVSATKSVATLEPSTVSVNDPFARYDLAALPVLSGTDLPPDTPALNAVNINGIRELARWGKPNVNQFAWIDGDQVLLAATSAGIYFYDPTNMQPRLFFDTAGALTAFALSDDAELVATADDQGTVVVWNLADGTEYKRLDGKAKRIKSLDFSPDRDKIIFSDAEKNIHFWNLRRDQYYQFDHRLTSDANKVLFSDAGDTVISGGDNFQISVWDATSGKVLEQYAADQQINDMALSSDGRYLALALNEATLQIWDLTTKKAITRMKIPDSRAAFTFVTFLPSDNTVLTGSADGFVRAWSVPGLGSLWSLTSANQDDHPGTVISVRNIAVSNSGTRLVVSFADGITEMWDISVAPQKREFSVDLGSRPIKHTAISPDDRVLAVQRGDSSVEIWSSRNGEQTAQVTGTLPRGNPISPNSELISVVQIENKTTVDVYRLSAIAATQPPGMVLYGFPANGSLAYSPDNNIIAAYAGNILRYWSASSGRELQVKAGSLRRENLCYTIYRQDGRFLVASSDIGVIFSDQNLQHFCKVQQNDRTLSEDLMPDGSIIALSLQNQFIEVWDAAHMDRKPHAEVQAPGDVLDVTISTDGTLLAAASAGGTIEIYELDTMTRVKTLVLNTGPVHQILFSTDGRYLIAGLADGTLRFFGLHP